MEQKKLNIDFRSGTWKGYLYQLQNEAPKPIPVLNTDLAVTKCRPPQYGSEWHGRLDRQEADKKCDEDGKYLIRTGITDQTRNVLIIRVLGVVKNFILYYEDGYHFVGEKKFERMFDLAKDGLITMYVESKAKDYINQMTNEPVYKSLNRYSNLECSKKKSTPISSENDEFYDHHVGTDESGIDVDCDVATPQHNQQRRKKFNPPSHQSDLITHPVLHKQILNQENSPRQHGFTKQHQSYQEQNHHRKFELVDGSPGKMTTCYAHDGEDRRAHRVSDVEGKEFHNLNLSGDRFKEQGKLEKVRPHRRSNVTPPLSNYQRKVLRNTRNSTTSSNSSSEDRNRSAALLETSASSVEISPYKTASPFTHMTSSSSSSSSSNQIHSRMTPLSQNKSRKKVLHQNSQKSNNLDKKLENIENHKSRQLHQQCEQRSRRKSCDSLKLRNNRSGSRQASVQMGFPSEEILKSNGNIQVQNHIGSPNKISPSHQSQLKNGYQDSFTQNENYYYYEKCHNFKIHTYKLQWCDYCGDFMWGWIQQGMQCTDCNMNVHKQCSKLLPADCNPTSKHLKRCFGVDLITFVKLKQSIRPAVVDCCVKEVESRGLHSEGLYRVPGNHDDILRLKNEFDQEDSTGYDVRLSEISDINTVCGVLKMYLRELPNPILPYQLYSRFINAAKLPMKDGKMKAVKDSIGLMPRPHYETFKVIVGHLGKVVQNSSHNEMTAKNLGIVFGPTLIKAPEPVGSQNLKLNPMRMLDLTENMNQQELIEFMITHRFDLFPSL